jgi:choline dehydrogenase-like flavoprotein
MLTLPSNDHLVDLDDCLSIGGMSVDDDFMAMIGDDDDSASASVFKDIMIQLAQEHDPVKDSREEMFRADSIRSIDAECWIDDELFVDAVDAFEDEEPAQAHMHSSQDFGMQQQQLTMNAQRQKMIQQPPNGSSMNNNAEFEELWNAKMALLARFMKRSEATRQQVTRQREILLAEQKQRQQQQHVQQQQRHHAAEQSRYSSSLSSSMMGGFQVPSAFAQQGRRLNGFMSSMTPNVL